MPARRIAAAAAALLILTPPPAAAHALKVFATAVGVRIEGRAYFVGGGAAAGARIRIETRDGHSIAETAADGEGRFVFTASARIDQVIVAEPGDGHSARWIVPASDLPDTLPVPSGQRPSEAREAETAAAPATAPPATAALRDMVHEAVGRQIQPLRQQLNTYEDRLRLRDILGGLGYIAGLAGLALWLKARRLKETRQ